MPMNRRSLLKALFALPVAALAAPLAAAFTPKPYAAGGIVPDAPGYLVGENSTETLLPRTFAGVDLSSMEDAPNKLVIHIKFNGPDPRIIEDLNRAIWNKIKRVDFRNSLR